MPSNSSTIVWFRRDLRLTDNPAWNHALDLKQPILPIYLHTPEEEEPWQSGAASNWWLHHALEDLDQQLQQNGLTLHIIHTRNSLQTLAQLSAESSASHVLWNRRYEPAIVKRDSHIKQTLRAKEISVQSFNGTLLTEPLTLRNRADKPFLVFTPFWKHCITTSPSAPVTADTSPVPSSFVPPSSIPLSNLNLTPAIPWDKGLSEAWKPTRTAGLAQLNQTPSKTDHYLIRRDQPEYDGTSRLSPYLHFGQLSPREVYHQIRSASPNKEAADLGILRQLYWREFSTHLLFHFPHSQNHALKEPYDLFPWQFDPTLLKKWQLGQTGFPIVDAGMRQLWQTGWMHNRVRMIAASFLVKHLLQPWQEGARWFWETLVDADLANNTMGWQWIAGSGADASPYFRVFNPILQGKKFDPEGHYVKTWLPELSKLPASLIHTPWEALPTDLSKADIALGQTYPTPVISHQQGRQDALAAYQQFKQS